MIKLKGILEKMGVGDEYYGTARVKNGNKIQLYRNTEEDRHSVGKRYKIKKNDYYLIVKTKGADYVVDTGTHILKKAGKWAQGYIQRKVGGTGKERFS